MTSIIADYIRKISSTTSQKYIALTSTPQKTTPFQSKLGGVPYLPPEMSYPVSEDGTALRLLAQLNFGDLPHIPSFPKQGILQFFVKDDEYTGVDYSSPTSQKSFRVLFHKPPFASLQSLNKPPTFDETTTWPYHHSEYLLTGTVKAEGLNPNHFDFQNQVQLVTEHIMKETGKTEEEIDLDIGVLSDALWEKLEQRANHRVGGFNTFRASDPREEKPDWQKYSVNLLQVDSVPDINIQESGVAVFLITPDNLAKEDFSDVLYWIDST